MPSEPAESNFKDKVQIPAYPTFEAGGVVWAYLGQPERQPAPPLFEWTRVAPAQRGLSRVLQENNWLQALEGGIDTVHSNFLHYGRPPGQRYDERDPRGRANNYSTAPRLDVVPTDFGYTYAGIRDMGAEGTNHVRAYHWIAPWTQIRGYVRGGSVSNAGHMWVPVDDENTMVFNWNVVLEESADSAADESVLGRPGASAEIIGADVVQDEAMPIWFRDARRPVGTGNDFGTDVDPTTFRSIRNRANRYLIDRQIQKTETFTGIQGINTQDRAVQESMGRIADRSLERLGSTDRAIIATRRFLLDALAAVAAGREPPGVAPTYYGLRAFEAVLPKDAAWYEAMAPRLSVSRPAPALSKSAP
jgi:phenylpropionate dioxygenase-like ring-hydroxylating dioxygenase large terminal subunit